MRDRAPQQLAAVTSEPLRMPVGDRHSATSAPELVIGPAASGLGGIFECSAYLDANAAHVCAELAVIQASGASLPVLRFPDGSLRTVYGLPRPFGCSEPAALDALAAELTTPGTRLT